MCRTSAGAPVCLRYRARDGCVRLSQLQMHDCKGWWRRGWRPRIGTDVLDDSPAHVDLEQNVDSGNMRRRRAPALAFHKSQTVRSFWDGIGPPRNPLTDSPPASPLQEDHTMQTTGGAPTSAASAGTSNAARQWQSTQHLHQWLFFLLF